MTDSKKEFLLKASAPSDAEVLEFIASCPGECLQFRNDDGSISLDGVKEYMNIKLKDSSRSDGRYTIKAPTEEELLEKVFLWHLENVEKIKEPTLASIFPEFLEYKKKTTWSESTAKRNLSVWKNHYKDTDIIHVPIRKIRLKLLQEWAYGLIEKHDLTQKEFGNVATWMKQMFEYAAMEEIIDRNPYTMLKITNRNVFRQPEIKSDEHKVLSPDMELALYRKCWEHFENKYYPVHQLLPLGIIMLFQAGLRPSELVTLRYSDVDGDGQTTISDITEIIDRLLAGDND